MGMKTTLASNITLAGGPSRSVWVRVAQSPYLFICGPGFTGTVAIEMSTDPMPNPDGTGGVTDANATWQEIVAAIGPGASAAWASPLTRIRVNPGDMLTGNAEVYLVENTYKTKRHNR